MHSHVTAGASRLAVIGLGRMGLPIARHLVDAGYDVVGHDRDPERMRLAADAGLVASATVVEAAADVDLVVTVLPGAAEFDAVMLSDDGVLASLRAGACWIDLTSNDPRVAERAAEASRPAGVLCVGAPMGGGVDAAEAAQLEFFVGGAADARRLAAPVLSALARPDGVHEAGDDIVSGYAAKLLINLLWFGQVAAVTEALLLGRRLGLATPKLRLLIAGSAADSSFAQRHLDRLLDGDYIDTFGLHECVDELDILTELAGENGSPFDLSNTVARLHHDALDRFGPIDGEMLVARLLEERDGMPLHRS